MGKIFLTIVNRAIFTLFALAILVSCENNEKIRKQFVWDEDVKELTGGNLHSWLEKSPFDNELKKYEKDKIVLTNAKQVFPFMGRYYNAIEELSRDYSTDTVIYQGADILFQDSIWGDLFLSATLLYDNQEVFLNDRYLETGNPFFGGAEAVTDMHRSSLYETSVVARNRKYKTGIYWVWTNYRDYLLGFYQQGQLVFEAVVPLLQRDTLATLDKLKEINYSLGLNIPEWENAEVEHLQRIENPETFWQDPFLGIYPGRFGNDAYLKIKDTPFLMEEKARKGDYYFAYRSDGGEVVLYTVMRKTEMSETDFNEANRKMNSYRYRYQDVFYEEQSQNGYVNGTAKTYFYDQQYLEIRYRYPQADSNAKEQVHDILKYIKVYKQS